MQDQCQVSGQEDTIQAYGISDIMEVIEHLSNNQDIVYMGIMGADVTTAVSEIEEIPIGVYVSEVAMDSPARALRRFSAVCVPLMSMSVSSCSI